MEERSVTAALRTLLLIVCALLPALPARAEGAPDLRPEAAPRSRVLDVALPAGAIRLTNPAPFAETTARLAALAKTEGYQMNGNEVLFWGGPGYGPKRGEEIRTDLIGALREAGLHYRVGGEQNLDGVAMTLFFAMPEGQEQGAVGAWVDNGKILLLIWGNASRLEAKPAPSHGPAGATVPTAAAPARSNAGAIPSGLIGTGASPPYRVPPTGTALRAPTWAPAPAGHRPTPSRRTAATGCSTTSGRAPPAGSWRR